MNSEKNRTLSLTEIIEKAEYLGEKEIVKELEYLRGRHPELADEFTLLPATEDLQGCVPCVRSSCTIRSQA